MTIEEILLEVEKEFQMGGLSDGVYADYAREVAKRFAAALTARSDELKKDAARYRWLREKVGVDFLFGDFNPWFHAYGVDMTGLEKQTTDESIDAAIAEEASHG